MTFECGQASQTQRAARSRAAPSGPSITHLLTQVCSISLLQHQQPRNGPQNLSPRPNSRRQRYGCHLVCSPRFPPGGLDLSMETPKVPDLQSLSESQPAQTCLPGMGPVRHPGGPEGSRPRDLSFALAVLGMAAAAARARLSFPFPSLTLPYLASLALVITLAIATPYRGTLSLSSRSLVGHPASDELSFSRPLGQTYGEVARRARASDARPFGRSWFGDLKSPFGPGATDRSSFPSSTTHGPQGSSGLWGVSCSLSQPEISRALRACFLLVCPA